MARAKHEIEADKPLYERDFCLWVDEQVRLLKEGRLQQLDIANLIDEIESLGIHEKLEVKTNLVVVLKHLLKYQYQPRRRSRGWLSSMVEHRRRLRDDLTTSPSLRGYAREQFEECYQDGRRQALIETASPRLPFRRRRPTPWRRPWTRVFCPIDGRHRSSKRPDRNHSRWRPQGSARY